jgi:hypothetical protein
VIRVIMEFDDSWTVESLTERVIHSGASFAAERVIVEEVHGHVPKDREVYQNHGRRY